MHDSHSIFLALVTRNQGIEVKRNKNRQTFGKIARLNAVEDRRRTEIYRCFALFFFHLVIVCGKDGFESAYPLKKKEKKIILAMR